VSNIHARKRRSKHAKIAQLADGRIEDCKLMNSLHATYDDGKLRSGLEESGLKFSPGGHNEGRVSFPEIF
jgi:hypothetical protein